jgi:hypothetical protein
MGIVVPCDVQLSFMPSTFNAPCYSSFSPYTHTSRPFNDGGNFQDSFLVPFVMLEGNSYFDGLFSDVI